MMQKIFLVTLFLGGLLTGGFFILNSYIYNEKQADTVADFKDATYIIQGTRVTLVGGTSVVPQAPGSSAARTVRYFGNDVRYDFDKDGRDDIAFLLTEEGGGSGTFYYLVAALNTERGYEGGEAMFIGDRIAPQTTEVDARGIVTVNYADRMDGESFAIPPSVGKSMRAYFDVASRSFGEVVQDFEGEADPTRMTLTMKPWTWVSASYNDEREVVPKKPAAFVLTFRDDGTFSASTDCNGVGGTYTAKDGVLTMGDMMSTLMFCEGSDEGEFTSILTNVSGYHFTAKGELVLSQKFDSGTALFR
jgi:heat shock protein HslJ